MDQRTATSTALKVVNVLKVAALRNYKVHALSNGDRDLLSDEQDPRADFECVQPPATPLDNYCLLRMGRVCWPEHWPLVLIIIDKLCRVAGITFNIFNAHRLVITAVSLTAKYTMDYRGVSQRVSHVGGIDNQDLIDMEMTFLELLDWRLNISRGVYDHVVEQLSKVEAAANNACITALIPDEVLPESMWRVHLAREESTEVFVAACTGATCTTTLAGTSDLGSRVCTIATEGCYSAYPYEVTPLSMLTAGPFEDGLGTGDGLQSPPAVVERFVPLPEEQRFSSAEISVDVDTDSDPGSTVLGRSRSRCSRFSVWRGTSAPSSPRGSEKGCPSPRAAGPRPPKHPRTSTRPCVNFVLDATGHLTPPNVGSSNTGDPIPVPGAAEAPRTSASNGMRARIEAARAYSQVSSVGE